MKINCVFVLGKTMIFELWKIWNVGIGNLLAIYMPTISINTKKPENLRETHRAFRFFKCARDGVGVYSPGKSPSSRIGGFHLSSGSLCTGTEQQQVEAEAERQGVLFSCH